MPRNADILRRWASLGRRHTNPPSWSPITRIVAAAVRQQDLESKHIIDLLKASKDRLSPLDDPLTIDLGLHRWMSRDREEAYSDWLAWVITQISCPAKVWPIFGLSYGGTESKIRVIREAQTTEGHAGKTGRVDIGIWLGSHRALAVELKLGNADEADTEKNKGYSKDWAQQPKVLVAATGDESDYGGFRLRTWGEVCIELRWLAGDDSLCLIVRALILAFVAAVEQNLLRFQGELPERLRQHELISPTIVPYLQSALRRLPNDHIKHSRE